MRLPLLRRHLLKPISGFLPNGNPKKTSNPLPPRCDDFICDCFFGSFWNWRPFLECTGFERTRTPSRIFSFRKSSCLKKSTNRKISYCDLTYDSWLHLSNLFFRFCLSALTQLKKYLAVTKETLSWVPSAETTTLRLDRWFLFSAKVQWNKCEAFYVCRCLGPSSLALPEEK